ncbi:MAG: C10 family peptidase [Bacteroidaceae bacterium]|nr:C10 family peptidase [Bacteroidaceae bacterium]
MKKLLVALMLSMTCINVVAQTISESKARANVLNFLTTQNTTMVKARQVRQNDLSLEYTARINNTPIYYVFNHTDGGFIIAGGDEKAEEILCYSNHGTFDITNIAPNFKYWLDEYERQISYAFTLKKNTTISQKANENRLYVPILLDTQWDQGKPYNSMCPKTKYTPGYTGCVATAMAQVMKYHEWPEKAHGRHSYTDYYTGTQYDYYFEGRQYDWNNMLNNYDTFSNEIQQHAVAQLMLDCGMAVEMGYDSDGSAAWSENIPYAMTTYFGYDVGIQQIYHNYCNDEEWEDYIYNELANSRPVLMGGANASMTLAHSFVCDGYLNGMYHFNWGWGGMSDCYCKLSAVKSSLGNFNYEQDIVIGIQPPTDNSNLPINIISEYGNMQLTNTISNGQQSVSVKFTDWHDCAQIYNFTYRDIDVIFSLKYENTQTGECMYAQATDYELAKYSFPSIYPVREDSDGYIIINGYQSIEIKDIQQPKLNPGTYNVTLVAKDYINKDLKDDTLWTEVRTYQGYKNYTTIVIQDPDEIENIKSKNTEFLNNNNYNILGQHIVPTTPTIIIQNGKKLLVK